MEQLYDELDEGPELPVHLGLMEDIVVSVPLDIGDVHHRICVPVKDEVHEEPSDPAVPVHEGMDRLETHVEVDGQDQRVDPFPVLRVPSQ